MSRLRIDDLRGIHAILFALWDRDENLDRQLMRHQVEVCLRAGVHGIAALGLATEVSKLTEAERALLMEWVAEDVARRVPLGFTIYGSSVAEQVSQIRKAESVGADWVILQPPTAGAFGAAEYIRFFGRVADATDLPVAIQNAPAYLGRGLTAADIDELTTQHPNIQLVKGEGTAVEIAALIERTGGRVAVLNGRGGLELVDNLKVGCSGMVLAPDCIDYSVRAYEHFIAGDEAGAEAAYAEMLPAATFIMQGIENFICYGKRIYGLRADIDINDRAPSLAPTSTGLAIARRFAEKLAPFTASWT